MSNDVLEQFLSEAREFLQAIGENLLALESRPDDQPVLGELFRHVHTLKGNCGLFDFPDMLRILHAAEDLMTDLREDTLGYSRDLADSLLESMDYVALLIDEIEQVGSISVDHGPHSVELARMLRSLRPGGAQPSRDTAGPAADSVDPAAVCNWVIGAPELLRQGWVRRLLAGESLSLVVYRPEADCFFKGEDPLHLMRQTPQLLWGAVQAAEAWPVPQALDIYRCNLCFIAVTDAVQGALLDHFRYVADQLEIAPLMPWQLIVPQGDPGDGPVHDDFISEALHQLELGDHAALSRAVRTMLELSAPQLWMCSVLRWLLCLLEAQAGDDALRTLLESLRTMQGPQMQEQSIRAAEGAFAEALPGNACVAVEVAPARQIRDALMPVLQAQQAVLAFGFWLLARAPAGGWRQPVGMPGMGRASGDRSGTGAGCRSVERFLRSDAGLAQRLCGTAVGRQSHHGH